MRRHQIVCAVAMALAVASCGGGPPMATGDQPSMPAYDGPMKLPMGGDEEAAVSQRAGAAGRALECEHAAFDGGGADYDSGLASTQDSAEAALENLFDEDGRGATLPSSGYRVERRADDRVLLSYDVYGTTKISFIAYDGIIDFEDNTGWGIESWAQCDPSELPASVTEALGIGVWEDASERRLPVSTIMSFDGAEHCGWQDISFLRLGAGRKDPEYVRDAGGELASELSGSFEASGKLPPSATDTGFRRDGRELWLARDKDTAYLVDVDDSSDVEAWPASKYRIGCA